MTFSRFELALIERAVIRHQSTLDAVGTPLDIAMTKLLKRVEQALLDDAAERYAKGDNQFAPRGD